MDTCGPGVAAIYGFHQNERVLSLCMHHTARHLDALTTFGWVMHALPARHALAEAARDAGHRSLIVQ